MVQTYQEQVRSRASNQQDLNVRADPDAFGAGIGRAISDLGRGVMDVAAAVDARDKLNEDNDARAASNRFMEMSRQLRYDPQSGYMTTTGSNAMGDARATFEDRLAAARDEAARGLSPRARAAYDRMTDSHVQSVNEAAIRHDAGQTKDFTVRTGQATADQFLQEAMLNYNNPEAFTENLGSALAELDRINAYNGMPAEAASVARRNLISGAYTGAVLRMADEGLGGASRAQAFLNENVDMFTADDKAKLDSALRPLAIKDQARIDANSAMSAPASTNYHAAAAGDQAARGRVEAALLGVNAATNVAYGNQGATRSRPITPGLEAMIGSSVEAVFGKGARAVVYSGGQGAAGEGGGRVGSTRHDHGKAADIHIYDPSGKQITGDRLGALAQFWLARGYGGVGLEMSGGGVHLDEHVDRARTWNYAAEGGSYTQGQRAAVALGQFGIAPNTAEDRMARDHMASTFGPGPGNAVLAAPASAKMETIIGPAEAARLGVAGKTAGQYMRDVLSAYGAPGAPQVGGGTPNFADGYAQAAQLMIDDPERGAAMYDEIRRRQEAHNASKAAAQQGMFDQFWERGMTSGDWFLSAQDRLLLGSGLSAAFDAAAQNALSGIQHTDPIVFTDLQSMAQTDPDNFMSLDLADFLATNELSAGDYRSLHAFQREMQNEVDPRTRAAALAKANDGIDPNKLWDDARDNFKLIAGFDDRTAKINDKQRRQIAMFKMALQEAVLAAQTSKGAELTAAERSQITYDLLRPQQVDDAWSPLGIPVIKPSTVFAFEASDLTQTGGAAVQVTQVAAEEIPARIADTLLSGIQGTLAGPQGEAISRRLASLGIDRDLSPQQARAELGRIYTDMLAVSQGEVPDVTMDDAPPELGLMDLGEWNAAAMREAPVGLGPTDVMGWAGVLGNRAQARWQQWRGTTEDTGEYLIRAADGSTIQVSQEDVLGILAEKRREDIMVLMETMGLTPTQVRAFAPVTVR